MAVKKEASAALWSRVGVLIAQDQLANAILRGDPDETLSSRAWRMRLKGQRCWGWTAAAIDRVFFWQQNHCRSAYESEAHKRFGQRGWAP